MLSQRTGRNEDRISSNQKRMHQDGYSGRDRALGRHKHCGYPLGLIRVLRYDEESF